LYICNVGEEDKRSAEVQREAPNPDALLQNRKKRLLRGVFYFLIHFYPIYCKWAKMKENLPKNRRF